MQLSIAGKISAIPSPDSYFPLGAASSALGARRSSKDLFFNPSTARAISAAVPAGGADLSSVFISTTTLRWSAGKDAKTVRYPPRLPYAQAPDVHRGIPNAF